jgi:mannose-6-phosphate isomerase-like protein (cupin superfamily)
MKMKKSFNSTTFPVSASRRDAIQKLAVVTAGLSLFSLASCKKDVAIVTPPDNNNASSFHLAPLSPLVPLKNGQNVRIWIRSNQMNTLFTTSEIVMVAKKMGPAPHFHKIMDELSFVLEGTVSFVDKGEVIDVPAGGWAMTPRTVEHTYFNKTDNQVRFMNIAFNQNFEDYQEELWLRIWPDMIAAGLTPADPGVAKKVADLLIKFDITAFPDKRLALIAQYGLKP